MRTNKLMWSDNTPDRLKFLFKWWKRYFAFTYPEYLCYFAKPYRFYSIVVYIRFDSEHRLFLSLCLFTTMGFHEHRHNIFVWIMYQTGFSSGIWKKIFFADLYPPISDSLWLIEFKWLNGGANVCLPITNIFHCRKAVKLTFVWFRSKKRLYISEQCFWKLSEIGSIFWKLKIPNLSVFNNIFLQINYLEKRRFLHILTSQFEEYDMLFRRNFFPSCWYCC